MGERGQGTAWRASSRLSRQRFFRRGRHPHTWGAGAHPRRASCRTDGKQWASATAPGWTKRKTQPWGCCSEGVGCRGRRSARRRAWTVARCQASPNAGFRHAHPLALLSHLIHFLTNFLIRNISRDPKTFNMYISTQ